MRFNVYVISYNRADTTTTYKNLEYCTYVVRKSQEQAYSKLGVPLLAVDDDLISSGVKVLNYLLDNAPEEVIAVLDDDIDKFVYRLDKNVTIDNPVDVNIELERLAQLLVDLDIGLLGVPVRSIPYGYIAEFNFAGLIGPVRIYNRPKIKSRYNDMPFFGDTDFVLQELLHNRIILRPNYFCADAQIETNAGGDNSYRTKHIQENQYRLMKAKWGKHISFNSKRNITQIHVKR
jgi:hypothetical protein